jgi:Amino acid permease
MPDQEGRVDPGSIPTVGAHLPPATVPIGVLGSLIIATLLYVGVSLVMTGLVSYHKLDVADPLAVALGPYPALRWLTDTLDLVALGALGATVLAILFGQSRILMRMAEDGLLPTNFSRVGSRTRTPYRATILCGVVAAAIAGLVPITTLANLVSIGTLAAFTVVGVGHLVAPHATGARAPLQGGVRLGDPGSCDHALARRDPVAACDHARALRGVAGDRDGDLFRLLAATDSPCHRAARRTGSLGARS